MMGADPLVGTLHNATTLDPHVHYVIGCYHSKLHDVVLHIGHHYRRLDSKTPKINRQLEYAPANGLFITLRT
jgi:hypothetical protein